jgi:hypothetical protein
LIPDRNEREQDYALANAKRKRGEKRTGEIEHKQNVHEMKAQAQAEREENNLPTHEKRGKMNVQREHLLSRFLVSVSRVAFAIAGLSKTQKRLCHSRRVLQLFPSTKIARNQLGQ